MEEIIWYGNDGGKERAKYRPEGSEVKVRLRERKNKGTLFTRLEITFYNDSDQKISHTGRCFVGVYFGNPKEIFFKEADNNRGYKIYAPRGTVKGTKMVGCVVRQPMNKNDWEGYYLLTYDTLKDMWRINIANRMAE